MRKLLTFLLFALTTAALAAPVRHDVEVMVQNAKAAEVKK